MTGRAPIDRALAGVPTQLLIGGRLQDAASGATFAVENPADGAVLARVADGAAAEARAAMAACVGAQAEWAAMPPRFRGEILTRAWERILAEELRLATLITLEMGKALDDARNEVRYAAEFLRWFAEEAVRAFGHHGIAPDGSSRLVTARQPVGPCVLVTPWNFPLAMATRKIGPAIAAGCTMTVKPAQQTPLSMLALADILGQCGLPAGVLNVVTTSDPADVVTACIEHPGARKLSFTGSTAIGRKLAAAAGARMLRVSMELGGDNPFIVFADADLDAAVEGAVLAKMRNVGQACTAANRFLVEAGVVDTFTARLAERMGVMAMGDGLSGAEVGPLIDARARDRVAGLVAEAVGGGARVHLGGRSPARPGYFFPPTVLSGVSATAAICRTEIFGPIAVVESFDSEAEAVRRANASDVGLAAYVFTRDLARAWRVFDALEVGMIGINRGLVSNPAAPFGGVKSSGLGREGGREGLEEYLNVKYASFPI